MRANPLKKILQYLWQSNFLSKLSFLKLPIWSDNLYFVGAKLHGIWNCMFDQSYPCILKICFSIYANLPWKVGKFRQLFGVFGFFRIITLFLPSPDDDDPPFLSPACLPPISTCFPSSYILPWLAKSAQWPIANVMSMSTVAAAPRVWDSIETDYLQVYGG